VKVVDKVEEEGGDRICGLYAPVGQPEGGVDFSTF
jgi:hypothetical protein